MPGMLTVFWYVAWLGNRHPAPDEYCDVIRQKTATLIAACCASGANSANQSRENIEKMRLFGEYAGIAFQIKDDLFDYTENPLIGKPTSIDIREQKMTLPLIYTLNSVNKKLKNYIINIVKNHHKEEKKVAEIINIVNESGGLKYAQQKMDFYHKKAISILAQFEDNTANKSLKLLLDYVVSRKKWYHKKQ